MAKYEYVTKNEYAPVRVKLEKIIHKVQLLAKKDDKDLTFQFKLVGSGSRHLITRVKGGNSGFDFDYNLILNPNYSWKAKEVKLALMRYFAEAVKDTEFDNPEDSTTSITIKAKDTKKSRILYSCDFAIVSYSDEEDLYKYIRHDKKNKVYKWDNRKFTHRYDEKLNWLKENIRNYWNIIKEEYIKLKNNNNDLDKHSFQLYYEAVSNVYDHQSRNIGFVYSLFC
ncbi:MAG: hypothetical protein IJS58_02690 [Bacilli bacterium]|nr:hypothetical protein [Bacilli bacterium]